MTKDATRGRLISRGLHQIRVVAGGEKLAAGIALVVVVWVTAYVLAGFPAWMASALEVVAAAVTLVMVFIIQHAQRRQEMATQLKLDELIRASDADDVVAEIEEADGDELERQRARRSTG